MRVGADCTSTHHLQLSFFRNFTNLSIGYLTSSSTHPPPFPNSWVRWCHRCCVRCGRHAWALPVPPSSRSRCGGSAGAATLLGCPAGVVSHGRCRIFDMHAMHACPAWTHPFLPLPSSNPAQELFSTYGDALADHVADDSSPTSSVVLALLQKATGRDINSRRIAADADACLM